MESLSKEASLFLAHRAVAKNTLTVDVLIKSCSLDAELSCTVDPHAQVCRYACTWAALLVTSRRMYTYASVTLC